MTLALEGFGMACSDSESSLLSEILESDDSTSFSLIKTSVGTECLSRTRDLASP